MNKSALRRTVACLVFTALAACGGGGSDNTEAAIQPSSITAVAGVNQNVLLGSLVTLDGSASAVPGFTSLTYTWRFVSVPVGSNVALSDSTSVKPTFTPDVAGLYSVGLVVKSGSLVSTEASVQIKAAAANAAPVASAGATQNSVAGSTITLDGSGSSDANGDLLSFEWALAVKPAGSSAGLDDRASVKPSFVADLPGVYEATLIVNDGKVSSDPARVTVNVAMANVAPVADAGTAQSVVAGTVITLDATKSSDANNDQLTYMWALNSRPAGSTASLSDATSAKPTFTADLPGVYVASLVVSDPTVASAPATVAITAVAANAAPIANAGPNQNVFAGNGVTLDGSASSDANNDQLTYRWSLTSRPTGSIAALVDPTSPKPTFLPDAVGTYVATLIVSDGKLESTPARVSISVAAANVAPVANAGPAQSVVAGTLVTLDGSASSDANNDTLTYAWTLVSRPASSTAPIVISPLQQTTFTPDVAGIYVVSLVVSDGKVSSSPSTVSISVSAANAAPVAHAGANQTVAATTTVTLDGTGSTDANGDVLTYAWSLVSRPAGSVTALAGETTAKPKLIVDIPGAYVISLVVSDGRSNSAPQTVTVIATAAPKIELYRASESTLFPDTQLAWPYFSGFGTISGTVLGSSTITVGEFKLKAVGGNFTIKGIAAGDFNRFASPSFVGLYDGQVIPDGQTVPFKIISTLTATRTASLYYTFDIAETRENFLFRTSLRTN
jgi:hypothetical protein